MKTTSKGGFFTSSKEFRGLVKCKFTHKVEVTEGDIDYVGPQIQRLTWHQILSFFKWTNDTMSSESQVRLYVHPQHGWRAWAFPQKARTGMAAEEIINKDNCLETADQCRERFRVWNTDPSSDWVYFCTVHHHCNCGAFQSGTDRSNEHHQDGLHITVGNMDKDRHTIHCRFYLEKEEAAPDMSDFWDVGQQVRDMIPIQLLDNVARYQMCEHVNVAFPDQWKQNVIEVKSAVTTYHYGSYDNDKPWVDNWRETKIKRCEAAADRAILQMSHKNIQLEDVLNFASVIDEDIIEIISEVADRDNLTFKGVMDKVFEAAEKQEASIVQAEEAEANFQQALGDALEDKDKDKTLKQQSKENKKKSKDKPDSGNGTVTVPRDPEIEAMRQLEELGGYCQ